MLGIVIDSPLPGTLLSGLTLEIGRKTVTGEVKEEHGVIHIDHFKPDKGS